MSDSRGMVAQGGDRWLLLIHQLPPKPDYVRVKVRRRLQGLGAVQLKPTVYVLPASDETIEDFQWLRQEIVSLGGGAVLCAASFLEGVSDEEISAMLEQERPSDAPPPAENTARPAPGTTWVTRRGVKVDRIASAWLIRRFIDREARFTFTAAHDYRPAAGECRFDMYDAEYSHEGEHCTFQTLVERFGLRDRALAAIGEIVHDIDCKDEKFGRPETAGVAGLIRGIVATLESDEARLERGATLFDDLYASFRKTRS